MVSSYNIIIFNYYIEQSYIEILFVNTKEKSNNLGVSIKSKKAFLNDQNNISFPNSKIQFNSINVNEDVFDVYILYNNKKLKSTSSDNNINYYRIFAKDIGVTNDDFRELNFTIVNGIQLKINIKIKNKYDITQKISVKDRLKFFNLKVEDSKKSEEEFYQKYKKWDDIKLSRENQKYKESNSQKLEKTKKEENPTPKKEEQPQPKKVNTNPKSISNVKPNQNTLNNNQNNQNTVNNNQNKQNTQNKVPKDTKNKTQIKEPKDTQVKTNVNNTNNTNNTSNKPPVYKSTNALKPNDKPKTTIGNKEKFRPSKTFVANQGETLVSKDPNELPTSNNEIFLEPTTYGQFCKEQKDKGIKHPYRETFCEGFFIASFPEKKGKVVEMSELFPSLCRHEECSKLPAMKPEIIFRYPLQDTKTLELNNLAATICFPTGIKVCYDETNGPNVIKDYVTSITNQKGERYYMMTYHFYIKLDIDNYQKRYEEKI